MFFDLLGWGELIRENEIALLYYKRQFKELRNRQKSLDLLKIELEILKVKLRLRELEVIND